MSPRNLTRDDLDEISASWRMSSYFKQMRHTRRCPRCDCWMAVEAGDTTADTDAVDDAPGVREPEVSNDLFLAGLFQPKPWAKAFVEAIHPPKKKEGS
jgi:hypothetical protein